MFTLSEHSFFRYIYGEEKMKKKALLVYPEIPATYWSVKHSLKFINKRASLPPLGLMTIASMFPENYELKLVDMNTSSLKDSDIIDADIIFISAMIIQKRSFDDIIKLCRKYKKRVVAGGPYPTSSYRSIKGVDHFILNESETIFGDFLSDLEKGEPKKIYLSEIKPDINLTPVPRFDLINVKDYNSMALQFSRGCPFNCEFCDIIEMFGRKPRTKNPENFIKELEAIYRTGFDGSVFIVDDNFIGNKSRVKELLVRIIEWQKKNSFPYTFFTEASIDLAADEELLDLMSQAGFDMVFIGIETPDENSLHHANKNQNLKLNMVEAVHRIQKRGIEVAGGFIVGFDTDKEDIFDRQIDFISRASIPMAMVGLLDVLPGTQLYRRLKKENRLLADSSGNNTHDLRLNFITEMPGEKLVEGYKKIISTIYHPKNYFQRCYSLLKRIPSNSLDLEFKPVYIKAFLMSLIKQSFSSYGFYYLKFITKVLFTNIKHFSAAISFAVKGYHFFRITDDIIDADEFSVKLRRSINSIEASINEILRKGKPDEIHLIYLKVQNVYTYLQKKYSKLSRDMQEYQRDPFGNFKNYYEMIMLRLKNSFNNKNNILQKRTG